MKYFNLTLIVSLFWFQTLGQIRPITSMGYSALIGTPSDSQHFQEVQLAGGIAFNNRVFMQLGFRHNQANTGVNSLNLEPMRNEVLSFEVGYRFLREQYLVSPFVNLSLGIPIYSNANEQLMYTSYRITSHYSPGVWLFNRGLFFGKLKALCDIKIESVNLLIGGSYNIFVYNYSVLKSKYGPPEGDYEVIDTKSVTLDNFGVEVGLMYTFPEKKKKGERAPIQ